MLIRSHHGLSSRHTHGNISEKASVTHICKHNTRRTPLRERCHFRWRHGQSVTVSFLTLVELNFSATLVCHMVGDRGLWVRDKRTWRLSTAACSTNSEVCPHPFETPKSCSHSHYLNAACVTPGHWDIWLRSSTTPQALRETMWSQLLTVGSSHILDSFLHIIR